MTFPPKLEILPERLDTQYRLPYYYRLGKTYVNFYKTGLKRILANRSLAREIQVLHKENPMIKSLGTGRRTSLLTGQLVSVEASRVTQQLSRRDYQLVVRTRKDLRKVPVMAILLLIFGEWLPLFVVFLDPLIPSTMLLTKQIQKRRLKSFELRRSNENVTIFPAQLEGNGVHSHSDAFVRAKALGLAGRASSILPTSILLRRLRRHDLYLRHDDELLREHACVKELDRLELDQALEERGLWRPDLSEHDGRLTLQAWLDQGP